MDNLLDKSVLATITYYDILDFPLTLLEVFRYLINLNRAENPRAALGESKGCPWIGGVLASLKELEKKGLVEDREGFYFLKGRQKIIQERIKKSKIAEEKRKKAKKCVFWLQFLPYVEIIFASGSLALGHTDEESDLDVLVVAKKGRIWLARLLLILAASFLGVRRTKYEKIAPDKICLNHFITDGSLHIPFESLYNAQTYAHVTPLYYRSQIIVAKFYEQNKWVKKFLPNCDWPPLFQFRTVKTKWTFSVSKKIVEFILDFFRLSGTLEKLARKLQKSRIDTNLPGRITVSDEQLEFHPYSVEKDIVEKFNQKISSFGFFDDYKELDSGLK